MGSTFLQNWTFRVYIFQCSNKLCCHVFVTSLNISAGFGNKSMQPGTEKYQLMN